MAATDRLVTPERAEEDSLEASLRPKRLSAARKEWAQSSRYAL